MDTTNFTPLTEEEQESFASLSYALNGAYDSHGEAALMRAVLDGETEVAVVVFVSREDLDDAHDAVHMYPMAILLDEQGELFKRLTPSGDEDRIR